MPPLINIVSPGWLNIIAAGIVFNGKSIVPELISSPEDETKICDQVFDINTIKTSINNFFIIDKIGTRKNSRCRKEYYLF